MSLTPLITSGNERITRRTYLWIVGRIYKHVEGEKRLACVKGK